MSAAGRQTIVVRRPSLPTMLLRGVRLRCAWCGGKRAFLTGWFTRQETCRTCGISWQRGYEGFELGAATISAIVTLGVLVVGVAAGVIATSPDVAVVPLVVGLGVLAVLIPVVVYPFSYTIWQAVDLAMRPPEAGDGAPPWR